MSKWKLFRDWDLEIGTSIKPKAQRAFGLIEIVVAVSILTIALAFLFNVAVVSLQLANDASKRIEAANFLEEGYEVVRSVRDESLDAGNWSTFTNAVGLGGERCLQFSGAQHTFTTFSDESECTIGGDFIRTITAAQGRRIGGCGGELNQSTGSECSNEEVGFFTITVKWNNGASSEALQFYLTNFQ